MPKPHINPPSKEELEELISSGKYYSDIARIYNVCNDTVARWVKSYNLKPPHWPRGLKAESGGRLRERTQKSAQTFKDLCANNPEFKKKILGNLKGGTLGMMHSLEARLKISERGKKAWKEGRKKPIPAEKGNKKERAHTHLEATLRILEELRKAGFKAVLTHKSHNVQVPDVIAMRDGKLYAVEVTAKLTDIKPKFEEADFDDIIWVIYSKRNEKFMVVDDKDWRQDGKTG